MLRLKKGSVSCHAVGALSNVQGVPSQVCGIDGRFVFDQFNLRIVEVFMFY